MKRTIIFVLVCTMLSSCAYASSVHGTIRDKNGLVVGYTRTYSNGKTVQYDKNWSTQNYYRTNARTGTVKKYDKHHSLVETYKK